MNSIPRASAAEAHRGLHAVALFEAAKGVLALLAATGMEWLGPAPLQRALDALLALLHLDPAHGSPAWLAHALNPDAVHLAAAVAVLYGAVRLAEAWGLWRAKVWASWLGLLRRPVPAVRPVCLRPAPPLAGSSSRGDQSGGGLGAGPRPGQAAPLRHVARGAEAGDACASSRESRRCATCRLPSPSPPCSAPASLPRRPHARTPPSPPRPHRRSPSRKPASPTCSSGWRAGAVTSHALTQAYLDRIAAIDKAGPALNSVIELNPDALKEADALDAERKAGKLRGPLHGIPVLLKDNIDATPMANSAGSLALADTPAEGGRLPGRKAARRRRGDPGQDQPVGVGQFPLHPLHLRLERPRAARPATPTCSTATPAAPAPAPAAAIAANLAAVGIGTETDGSIICPSAVAGLVGLKPTVGLVSRSGIIPISASPGHRRPDDPQRRRRGGAADRDRRAGRRRCSQPRTPAGARRSTTPRTSRRTR